MSGSIYTALKTEIALPAYSGMTDAQIATALNTANITVYSAVPTYTWGGYLMANGFLLALQKYVSSPPSGASALAEAAAAMILALLSSPTITSVNLADPTALAAVQGMLAALVAEGTAGRFTSIAGTAFATAHENAMLAMGTSTVCRAQQLGFNPAVCDMTQEIAAARKWG